MADEIKIQSWGLRANSFAPGKPIPIYLEIENFGFDPYCDEMMLTIEEDAYFNRSGTRVPVKRIDSLQKVRVDFELAVKAVENLEDLPRKKEVSLINKARTKVASICIAIPIEPFVNWLKTRDAVKCLLFGQIGTGKSSFINSVITLYSNFGPFAKDVKNVAFSCAADSTVTKGLSVYNSKNLPVFSGSNLTMLDTWGYEKRHPERWNEFIFEGLCRGRIPEKFDIVQAATFSVDSLSSPNVNLAPDVVVIALTPAAASDAEYVAVMTTYIRRAVDCGFYPIILLTQVDNVDPKLRENPYITNPVLDDIRATVASQTRLNMSDIIPVINYSQELERTWDMDRAAFVAVRHIFLKAELRIQPSAAGRSGGSSSSGRR